MGSQFREHVRQLLSGPGGLTDLDIRRAFDGYGFYEGGVLFGWVWNGQDEFLLRTVRERTRSGRPTRYSYSPVPADSLEDPEQLLRLARAALGELS